MLWIIVTFALTFLMFIAASMLFTVEQERVAIVQRFGKHQQVATAGLNVKIPMIDKVVTTVDLRVQEMIVHVETKTLDNVFVRLAVAVQYQVRDPYNAFYKLSRPQQQIESFVFDVVRARVPSLELDHLFAAKDDVADAVRDQLAGIMAHFGYNIVRTLVTDIDPDAEVKASMNRINAAERLKLAAEREAEAAKIHRVKAAEAEAESKHLQGLGIARQRKAIADGLSESAELVQDHLEGVSAETVMSLLLLTQYFDTLQNMAEQSGTRTIFLPHTPAGMSQIYEQVQQAIMVGHEAREA